MKPKPERLAAIDIGSDTVHLLIGEVAEEPNGPRTRASGRKAAGTALRRQARGPSSAAVNALIAAAVPGPVSGRP